MVRAAVQLDKECCVMCHEQHHDNVYIASIKSSFVVCMRRKLNVGDIIV